MAVAPLFPYVPPLGLRDQVFDTSLVLLRGTGLCGITFYPQRIIRILFLVPFFIPGMVLHTAFFTFYPHRIQKLLFLVPQQTRVVVVLRSSVAAVAPRFRYTPPLPLRIQDFDVADWWL